MSNEMKKYMRLMESTGQTNSGCTFVIDDVSLRNAEKEAIVIVSLENCEKMEDSTFTVDDVEYQLKNVTVEMEFKISEEEFEIPGSTSRMLSNRYRSIKVINSVDSIEVSDVYMTSENEDEIVDVDKLSSDAKKNITNSIESDSKLMDKIIKEVEDRL